MEKREAYLGYTKNEKSNRRMTEFNHTLPIVGLSAFWLVIMEVAHRLIPVPNYVTKQKKTEAEKRKDYFYFVSRWVGLIHGIVATINSIRVLSIYGWDFGGENEAPHMFTVYVSHQFLEFDSKNLKITHFLYLFFFE